MRNGIGAVVVLAAAFFIIGSASAHRLEAERPSATCDGASVKHHVHRAHALLRKTYEDHFNLPDAELVPKAQKHKLCIRIGNVRDDLGEFRAERKQAWYENVNPYSCVGRRWALPCAVTGCESGYNYTVGFAGAYGMLPVAWNEWGGPELAGTSTAGSAKPIHQDIIAHRGWVLYNGWWECPV